MNHKLISTNSYDRSIKLGILFIVACFFSSSLSAAKTPPSDIVTTRSGDIYNGTVKGDALRLLAPYHDFSIPIDQLSHWRATNKKGVYEISTVDKSRFTGHIEAEGLVIERVLDVMINLHPEDIAEIEFAHPPRQQSISVLDSVSFINGDILRGRITSLRVELNRDTGRSIYTDNDIHILDIEHEPGSRAQVRLSQGNKIDLGELAECKIKLQQGQKELAFSDKWVTAVLYAKRRQKPVRKTPPRSAKTGQAFQDPLTDGGHGPVMVVIEPGTFEFGDLQGDGDTDERPSRTVTIKSPFAIGKYEVTFDEYDLFCAKTGRELTDDSEWGRGQRPAVNIPWQDAGAYTEWLTAKSGKTYRLPSSAEWEYVARAGTKGRYWWGDEVSQNNANCEECGGLWEGEKTAPVGRFPANPFGLHDTSGNVWELVGDCYSSDYNNQPTDGSALVNMGCGKRVIRGGAWSFPPAEARSANRWREFPSRPSDDTGFRVLREMN